MIASTPPPTYAIGTALLVTLSRGVHATKPKRLRRVEIRSGSFGGSPPLPGKNCRVSYSLLTPEAKHFGIESIRTDWCSS